MLLEAYLEKQGLCVSVKMENDANCAALGEGIGGAHKAAPIILCLLWEACRFRSCSAGVCSLVLTAAGEAGHMSVGAETSPLRRFHAFRAEFFCDPD